MRIVTGDEMRRIDNAAIKERGIAGLKLMERAGQSVTNIVLARLIPRNVTVVTGKGNNAGDGFVVARLLKKAGLNVTILMLAPEKDLSGDALTNFQALSSEIPRYLCENEEQISMNLEGCECVIDAMLGTGVKGDLRGVFAKAVKAINVSGKTVVAVDIPSGLPSDVTYFNGLCVHADFTVTMGLPKLGMMQHPASRWCGEIVIADIGFPRDLMEAPRPSRCNLITPKMVREKLPERPSHAHKGSFGSVLVTGGSAGMTGAAVMTALSAARSGAGLVFVAIPESLNQIFEIKLTEPLTIPLATEKPGTPDIKMFPVLKEKAKQCVSMALGPGMGRDPGTVQLIRETFKNIEIPVVLDADGLNAFEGACGSIRKRSAPAVLTPHPGEFARLLKMDIVEVQKKRIELSREFASEYNKILVLKGAGTVIAEPGGEVFISSAGNTSLSKGGSGDVLTGLIAGFLAQGVRPLDSAVMGVYIQGLAGEWAGWRKSNRAVLPGDMLEILPEVFSWLDPGKKPHVLD